MLGLCSAIARVGGISAPWVAVYLPAQVFTPIHSTLDFVERTLFQGNGAPCMVALRLWELLRRGGTPGCTLSHGDPWPSSPQHLRGFLPNSYLRHIPFQDLERMKAEAKPTWKCVWPSRDEDKEKLGSAYSLSSASVTRVA